MIVSMVILAIAFCVWAALHSLTASTASKAWVRRRIGTGADRWYRLAYNAFAVISFLPLLPLLALLPDQLIYVAPSPWSWLLRLGQLAALLGLLAAFLQTNPFHFIGLAQLSAVELENAGSLVVRGLYCRVRHPLYFFSILLIWLNPTMTALWLTVCILFTLYFYLGSLHEERRLLAEFGLAYADYQRRVPMLFPRPGRCAPPTI